MSVYKATKTRSNRPGWSVTFGHPRRRDARGKFGLKVRRGLGTPDDAEADRLVGQINALLSDETWWSVDRRADAERQFDSVAVAAFFDGIEVGKISAREMRESIIPLPTPKQGYARVMLLGSTGAGKTTLLRQFIGSDHTRDRFPSTSTAKTTTAEIEIVISSSGPFHAVVTFMTEHQVRCAIDECLEEACTSVVLGNDDSRVAAALLEHREQRFRLSYVVGRWQQETANQEADAQYDMDYGDDQSDPESLPDDEKVDGLEVAANNKRLQECVARIRDIVGSVSTQMTAEYGEFHGLSSANERQEWLESFVDQLYDYQDFGRLSLDLIDDVHERFSLIEVGDYERSATGWPTLWYFEEDDRDAFLQQVRWFTSNHDQQFGRLLTPLVDGIRVRGPFVPTARTLQGCDRRLVLVDGEGLGHSAKEATSVSTRVTERFPEADMILLVDNAQSPMQAAALELLRSAGSSGHGHKIAVVFTHFDQVRGDNLRTYTQKREHVRASTGNAIGSLREALGAPVTEILERRLESNTFFLGGLNRATGVIPRGFINDLRDLMERMQQSGELHEPIDVAPIYHIVRLELSLRDATDGFKNPWRGRLGLAYYEGIQKEHWGRIKALCRRIANLWGNDYNGLRPVADFVKQLQSSISLWLDNPSGWTKQPEDDDERQSAIDEIRREIYARLHVLAEQRLVANNLPSWQTAFAFSGTGSSYLRAGQMAQIHEAAAPSIASIMDSDTQAFLDEIIQIVGESVRKTGGSVTGIEEE